MYAAFTPHGAALQRTRGPHPLPLFLALAAQVADGDAARLARILAGVRAYQAHGYRRELPVMPEVARIGCVTLRDYGGDGRPVVVVPSLINPPHVLDLAPGNSMLRWLAAQQLRPLLVDWGTPGEAEEELSLGKYITDRLVPLIAGATPRAALLGYCIGGTLALAAAQLVPVARLALLATPWRFAGYSDAARAEIASLWTVNAGIAATLGGFPIELLQPAFWQLDAAALMAKFEHFPSLAPAAAAAFAALEDWANDGPPLPIGVARDMFQQLFSADLPGTGAWVVGGVDVDPARLGVPLLDVVSTRDRIVPAATSVNVGERLDLDLGHVGMVVGSRARGALWEPLAAWLRAD